MGPPYSSANGIYPSPTLTLHMCGAIYQDLCVHLNPLVTWTIGLLIIHEYFISLEMWLKFYQRVCARTCSSREDADLNPSFDTVNPKTIHCL